MEECAGIVANGHQKRGIAESARRNHRVSLRAVRAIVTTQVDRLKGYRLKAEVFGTRNSDLQPESLQPSAFSLNP